MPLFAALAALLIGGGLMLGLYVQDLFPVGAWLTGVVLLAFAVLGRLET